MAKRRKYIKIPIDSLLNAYVAGTTTTMKDKLEINFVKNWYVQKYPDDTLGQEIPDNVTFLDVFNSMAMNGQDIYNTLNVSDSIIRERVMGQLAELMGESYNVIYYLWLNF